MMFGGLHAPGILWAFLLSSAVLLPAEAVHGQITESAPDRRAPAKAAALSLLLPGLGQRYADGGSWGTAPTLFALADAAVWVGLFTTVRTRNGRIDSYRALAASGAGADLDGKDRRFFLNLATFRSSDEYLEVQLRNRAWDRLDYVQDPAFQWAWTEESDFQAYRDLRGDAESLGRRRSILIAALVTNRVVSALLAVRAAGRANGRIPAQLSFGPPPPGAEWPTLNMAVRF